MFHTSILFYIPTHAHYYTVGYYVELTIYALLQVALYAHFHIILIFLFLKIDSLNVVVVMCTPYSRACTLIFYNTIIILRYRLILTKLEYQRYFSKLYFENVELIQCCYLRRTSTVVIHLSI